MKILKLLLSLIVFISVLAIPSCKKNDFGATTQKIDVSLLEQKFFNTHRSNDPTEKALVNFLQKINDKENFVVQTALQIGFPRWDKAIASSKKILNSNTQNLLGDSTQVFFIPFVRDAQNYVNASMVIYASATDTTFTYRCDWQYAQFVNNSTTTNDEAENVAAFFMTLDNAVFGYTQFKINDKRLFKPKSNIHVNDTADYIIKKVSFNDSANNIASNNFMAYECTNIVISYVCSFCYANDPDCPLGGTWQEFYQFCDWVFYPDNGGGGTGGNEPGGGGGGNPGGGGNTPPPCDEVPIDPLLAGRVINPCDDGPGWEPEPLDNGLTDANGYYYTRIAQLDSLLNSDEFAIVPCDSLALITMRSYGSMYQDVASFTASPNVLNRLDSIRNIVGSTINMDNWNIQNLNDADGAVVNCDYFPLQINSFPINPQTGIAYTPADYLEYFRKNINSFITSPVEASFNCDFDVQLPNTPPGTTWNDCIKFNLPFNQSVGAVWHINIPGPLGTSNDGSVIISGYEDTIYTGGSHHINFTVSTLETPFDFEHPVAGNRRFGLFNTLAAPNTWTFYTMGVDRVNNWLDDRFIQRYMFQQADALWNNVLGNVAFSIANSSGGSANYYQQHSYIARPQWENVKAYLKNEITLAQLKSALGC